MVGIKKRISCIINKSFFALPFRNPIHCFLDEPARRRITTAIETCYRQGMRLIGFSSIVSDLFNLLRHLGFEMRIKGGHHIFRKVGIAQKPNLQKEGNKSETISGQTDTENHIKI